MARKRASRWEDDEADDRDELEAEGSNQYDDDDDDDDIDYGAEYDVDDDEDEEEVELSPRRARRVRDEEDDDLSDIEVHEDDEEDESSEEEPEVEAPLVAPPAAKPARVPAIRLGKLPRPLPSGEAARPPNPRNPRAERGANGPRKPLGIVARQIPRNLGPGRREAQAVAVPAEMNPTERTRRRDPASPLELPPRSRTNSIHSTPKNPRRHPRIGVLRATRSPKKVIST
jgi:hypothetical protein